MDTRTFESILTTTADRLSRLANALETYLQNDPNQRAALLGRAFAQQLDEVRTVVARIVARTPRRARRRVLRTEQQQPRPADLHPGDDSRALTTWLVRELQVEHQTYRSLLDHSRIGPARSSAAELAAFFMAQSKRIALEAHRFQDL